MAKPKRWFLRFIIFSAVLVAAPVALAPLIPLDTIKPEVESRLSNMLGRQVTVGSLRLSLLGGPYLFINNMVAKEDSAFGQGNFLEASQVRANFSIFPFIVSRQVVLDSLRIKSPSFTFTKNRDGVWSWTTIGKPVTASAAQSPESSETPALYSRPTLLFYIAALLSDTPAASSINSFHIEGATVRLVDNSGAVPPETVYKNVELHSSIIRAQEGGAANSSRAKGEMRANSDGGEGAELLRADMPFDLIIDRTSSPTPSVRGSLGPGRLESKNLDVESFKSSVDMKGNVVTLDQMEIRLYDGTMRGRMELDLTSQRFTAEAEVENLNLDQAISSKLDMPGQITGHVNAKFKLSGEMRDFKRSIETIQGSGRMTSNEMFISSVNVSEQVARALKIDQIGDMNPGTVIGSLESDFQINGGVINTTGLRIQQLDGLGDATSPQGWLNPIPTPSMNYSANVLLSSDATARAKSANALFGAAITIFEYNNRVSIPLSISGDVRNPQVQVDLMGFLR